MADQDKQQGERKPADQPDASDEGVSTPEPAEGADDCPAPAKGSPKG